MDSVIELMLNLQRHRSAVVRCEDEIATANVTIKEGQKKIDELENQLLILEDRLKSNKNLIKQGELDLSGLEERKEKAKTRLSAAASQKEMDALNHEIEKFSEESGSLEEELLTAMDNLSILEAEIEKGKEKLADEKARGANELNTMQERIARFTEEKSKHQNEYDGLMPDLPVQQKGRFTKLAASDGGIAIVKVDGGVCGGCHFNVPAAEASNINDGELGVCSNCGKFLYKE